MTKLNIHESWKDIMLPLLQSKEAEDVLSALTDYHPDKENIFKAFHIPISSVKLVIVGQDVYPNKELATGISFAVPEGKDSASLRTIRRELSRRYSEDMDSDWFLCYPEDIDKLFDNTLNHWTSQGVLMLNGALTCNKKAGDQWDIWNPFMKKLFQALDNNLKCPFVFLGKKSQEFGDLIENNKLLNFPHPAADSYGIAKFYGCRIFEEIEKNVTVEWI